MRAKYYTPSRENSILCDLCPHRCLLMPGHTGKCKVRTNRGGVLYADTYGHVSATHFDPVEKKPLYHFHPGSEIFSIGSLGCNFKCSCCQNYEISQTGISGFPRLLEMTVDEVITTAKAHPANIGIAFTYNEPFVWFEYMLDIAQLAKKEGLKNVVVSNGYCNPEPLEELLRYIDAFNIDLKAFDARSYKDFTGGELPFVLHSMDRIVKEGKHLEITMLIVPGLNDSMVQFDSMVNWIRDKLGKSVPLHLSRYFPQYQMKVHATAVETLKKMAERASEQLDYVYLGNITGGEFQNTHCPECSSLAIQRKGYSIHTTGLGKSGTCASCGHTLVKTD